MPVDPKELREAIELAIVSMNLRESSVKMWETHTALVRAQATLRAFLDSGLTDSERETEISRLKSQLEIARERARRNDLGPNNCKCSICGHEHYDIAGPAV